MTEKTPLVSIGLPVYNGEKYLKQAIDSILAQTFTDFELIICDNASTDRTAEICQQYAAQDPRVRYYRNEKNIGGGNNHILTYKLSRGKYFRWAAHDDICAPDMLAQFVNFLDINHEIVLCYSTLMRIDENSNPIEEISQPKATSVKPSVRFRELTSLNHMCESTYGLIRSDVLSLIDHQTGLYLNYADADRTLLCQISLYGRFFQLPETLFFKRYHPDMSTQAILDVRERVTWFYPNEAEHISCPNWLQFFHYLRILSTAPLTFRERFYCYSYMIPWIITKKRWGKMIKDLYCAGVKIIWFTYRKTRNIFHSNSHSVRTQ